MALTGNKGEWSEVYTLLKLLGDGVVYAGDEHLNKIKDLFYPIIMILRQEKDGDYNYRLEDTNVVIETPNKEILLCIPAKVFYDEAEKLLIAINSNNGAFAIPQAEVFMKNIYCHSLKAKSSDKTDIHIILHDRRTGMNSNLGFSIKSQLGSNSTLLNASKATNLTYRIEDVNLSDKEIEDINSINPKKDKVIKRVEAIKEKGGNFIFDYIDSPIFERNLRMLDGNLPVLVADLLLEQLNTGVSTLEGLAEILAKKDPLCCGSHEGSYSFYSYKIKHLLTSCALGMMPATAWDGKLDANGGYLVVKENGDILCYHFYDRNRFEDYLFFNAYLERSSTTKHEYATILKEKDGKLLFKLNFQIRLK